MVFGCVLENNIENTFSQLQNKYIISFINTKTQKKQNLEKKFIKSGHTKTQKKQNPEKKNSSNRAAKARSSGVGVDLCLIGAVRLAIGAGVGRRTLESIGVVRAALELIFA